MSRPTPLLRSALIAAVGLAAAALLTGCFAPPVPIVTETPKPEDPDFGAIGGDPVPIETDVQVDPGQPDAGGYTALLDDLGVLTVTVPDSWTDVNGAPFTTEAGQQWASITAAPDIQGYLDNWNVPGLEISATGLTGVTDEGLRGLLASVTQVYGTCSSVVRDATPYDDGFFTGFESAYTGCGTDTSAFAIVGTNAARTQAVFVRAQVTSDLDADAVYLQVVNSFDTTLGRAASGK